MSAEGRAQEGRDPGGAEAGSGPAGELVVVLCNAPPDRAEELARALVERRLAACVNVVPGIVSFYWWQGALTRDPESTLLVKTRRELVPALTAAIRGLHPYEVPEVVALRIEPELGNLEYHAWVMAETAPPGGEAT